MMQYGYVMIKTVTSKFTKIVNFKKGSGDPEKVPRFQGYSIAHAVD